MTWVVRVVSRNSIRVETGSQGLLFEGIRSGCDGEPFVTSNPDGDSSVSADL
jgi:hypothetical protein